MFVVFEGGEGSGKSTMIERVKEKYSTRSDIVYTRDPVGTELGEKTRDVVLSSDGARIDPIAELLLFHAARAQLMSEVIAPALKAEKVVICNRFELSAIAYQIYGRQRTELLPLLRSVSATIIGEHIPDVCIFLDVSPEVGIKRAQERNEELTRFDLEQLDFHERVRAGFKKHLGEYGQPVTIDADQPMEVVWREVEKALQSVL